MVERCLAKANVAGPNPVSRSNNWHHSQAVRQRSAKPLFPGPIPGGASRKKEQVARLALFFNEIRLRRVKFGNAQVK